VTIYLDANAIIYAIEGAPPFRDAVIARLAQSPQASLVRRASRVWSAG